MFQAGQLRIKGSLKSSSAAIGSKGSASMVSSSDVFLSSPVDQAHHAVTQNRQWGTLTIVKAVDSSSALLVHAMATKQKLDSIVIEADPPPGAKRGQKGSTLTLHDVAVTRIQKHPGSAQDPLEKTEVSFTYQKIEYSGVSGKKSWADDWS
jgi:type VI secretion system Hcp family effector